MAAEISSGRRVHRTNAWRWHFEGVRYWMTAVRPSRSAFAACGLRHSMAPQHRDERWERVGQTDRPNRILSPRRSVVLVVMTSARQGENRESSGLAEVQRGQDASISMC